MNSLYQQFETFLCMNLFVIAYVGKYLKTLLGLSIYVQVGNDARFKNEVLIPKVGALLMHELVGKIFEDTVGIEHLHTSRERCQVLE